MTNTSNEFSRTFRLDALGAENRLISIRADPAECAALARRFGMLELDLLSAEAMLAHDAHGIGATGKLFANGSQACVVTGEPLPFSINEQFAVRFVAPDEPEPDSEIELDVNDCDIIEHDGNVIDLGEAVAQSLSLAIPPFPRGPNAEAALKNAGVLSEGEAGPFGALAALKDLLTKR